MQLMAGKKGIIFGISNKWGIAYNIAKVLIEHGAEVVFSYAGEAMKSRVEPIAKELGVSVMIACDVTDDNAIKVAFESYSKHYDCLDFVIHAVAFAKKEDLSGNFYDTSREGWDTALGVSAYSLVPITKYAKPLMSESGSIVALSYLGSERTVPFYNVMGVAKAALEATVRYLAVEMGAEGIRVNALSSGPIKTLAAKGISGFDVILKLNKSRAPLKRNLTPNEVGNAALYLCSDLSSGVTGEVHHVDCGFHSIAICKEDAKIVDSVLK